MSPLIPIAWIVVAYAAVVTVLAAVGVAVKAPRPRWLDQMAWMLELLVAVLAVGALGSVLGGHRPESMSTHLGYLAASVCIVPVALGSIRDDRGTWSSGVVAVAALATGVIAVRIMMTR